MHLVFLKWAWKGGERIQTQIRGVLRRGEGRRRAEEGDMEEKEVKGAGGGGEIIRPGLAGIPPCRFLLGL